MASSLTIRGGSNHEYHVRTAINGHEVDLIIDSGFTHPDCEVGVALDDTNCSAVVAGLREPAAYEARPFAGESLIVESGVGFAALIGLDGSEVETRILNAGANLLGVCYFHRLLGFAVSWHLAERRMIITRT